MARLVYGLSQSLDGYVDHMKLGPSAPAAFRPSIGLVRGATGLIYGRRTYEIMRYWDEDLPDWDAEDREFAWCGGASRSGSCRFPRVSWPQLACHGWPRKGDTQAEGRAGWRDSSCWTSPGAKPDRGGLIDKCRLYLRPPSCLVVSSYSSRVPGRRSTWWPAI